MPINPEAMYQLKHDPHAGGNAGTIAFYLPEKSHVIVKILNAKESEVRILINESLPAGACQVNFLYGNLSPGEYKIKLIVQTENIIDISSLPVQLP